MIETRSINAFLIVAREQNITKAAAALHISQPALSAQIAALEKELGLKLFTRTNKNTVLTEDGLLFQVRAQELMELMNKIENEFTLKDGDISGDVFFGCAETNIMAYIGSVFHSVQREHPDIHFHIYSGNADAILERLDKGLLDIGLLIGADFRDKFEYRTLGMYDTFGLLIPADCPLAENKSIRLEELTEMPIMRPAQNIARGQNLQLFDRVLNNVIGTYNLITNVTYLVEQGIGYALCLSNLVNIEGRNLKFIPLESALQAEAYIVTKKYAYLSKPARALLNKLYPKL